MKCVAKPSRGFLLLEALLATAIFAISITSIVVALNHSTKFTDKIKQEEWVERQFQIILVDVLKTPRSEQEIIAKRKIDLTELGACATIEPKLLDQKNADGNKLKKIYEIKILLEWEQSGKRKSRSKTVLHYPPLYRY